MDPSELIIYLFVICNFSSKKIYDMKKCIQNTKKNN